MVKEAIVDNNKSENEIFDCWIVFYRERICEVAGLKQRLDNCVYKYNRYVKEGKTKEAMQIQKRISRIEREYELAKEKLDLTERLEHLRLTNRYKLFNKKMINAVKGNYEDKEAIEFLNTGYTFMQTENYITYKFSAALYKDGQEVC